MRYMPGQPRSRAVFGREPGLGGPASIRLEGSGLKEEKLQRGPRQGASKAFGLLPESGKPDRRKGSGACTAKGRQRSHE